MIEQGGVNGAGKRRQSRKTATKQDRDGNGAWKRQQSRETAAEQGDSVDDDITGE